MNVMLLTAGEGTRLRPHTEKIPKPGIPFLNIPLFLYSIKLCEPLGIQNFILNTYHLSDELKSRVSASVQLNDQGIRHPGLKSARVLFSDETRLLGSGGGIGHARNLILNHHSSDEHFLVMNGDEVILPRKENMMLDFLKAHTESKSLATLMVKEHPGVGTQFGGVWVDKNRNVLGFGKTPILGSHKGFHFVGASLYAKEVLNNFPPGESNILYDVLTKKIQDGHKVSVFEADCSWYETGNEADFKLATKECLKHIKANDFEGKYLKKILNEVVPDVDIIQNDQTFSIVSTTAQLDRKLLRGFNVVGARVVATGVSSIQDSILGPGVIIKSQDPVVQKMILF